MMIKTISAIFLLSSLAPSPSHDAAADKAVAEGIKFLLSSQRKEGSWWDGLSEGQIQQYGGTTAVVALGLMANAKADPGIGDALTKAQKYLMESQQIQPVAIGGRTDGRYWNYAFSLLCLVRMHQEKTGVNAKPVIEQLIDALAKSQQSGSWSYHGAIGPMSCLTSIGLVALLEAKGAGFSVPDDVVKQAVGALKRVRGKDGNFWYKTHTTGDASGSKIGSAGRNPGNELALYLAGESDKAKLTWAVGNFFQNRGEMERVRAAMADRAGGNYHVGKDLVAPYYYLYGYLFTAQVLLHLGDGTKIVVDAADLAKTKSPKECLKILQEDLLRIRRANGSWRDSMVSEDKYGTAAAILILNPRKIAGLSKKK